MKNQTAQLRSEKNHIDRAIASLPVVVVCAVALVLIPVLLVIFALPVLANFAAQNLPVRMEKSLGNYILNSGELLLDPTQLSAQITDQYRARVEKLAAVAQLGAVEVHFRAGLPNALALPGNIVVLTDGLVKTMADGDAIDAVIAHELGHLHHRHLIKTIVSTSLLTEVVLHLNSESAATNRTSNMVAGLALSPHYSRANEREADRYAIELLIKNQQSPLLFAKAMRLMAEAYKSRGGLPSGYTASHPDMESRAQMAENYKLP